MADHRKYLALAKRLIDKHGRDVVFETISKTPADPSKPWNGTGTQPTLDGPFKAVFLPYKATDFGSEFISNDLVKDGEEYAMVAGQDVNLENAHVLIDDGVPYKIRWVQRLKPADLTLLYAFGVER